MLQLVGPRDLTPDCKEQTTAMTNEDFEQLQTVGRHLVKFRRIGILSPVPKRRRRPPWRRVARSEFNIFPCATAVPQRTWDLNVPGKDEFDLIVASSVLTHSADPDRWLNNVLASCEYLLMIDLVRRRRSKDSEFGGYGDCVRYAIGTERPRVEQSFNLNTLGNRLLGFRTYYGGASAYDEKPLHLIALVRGELALPDDADDHARWIETALAELEQHGVADEANQV